MKFDTIGLPFKTSMEEEVASILYHMCMNVRDELSRKYAVHKGEHQDYAGLCDIAVNMLHEQLKQFEKDYGVRVDFKSIHGEQKHSPYINSCLWPLQHTWAKVKMMGVSMYVDPTAGQFKRMYNFIPEVYVSTRKPKWYYPDSSNPVHNTKITTFINKHIKMPVKHPVWNGHIHKLETMKVGIIEFLQFEVWGRISDSRNRQHYKWVRMR